MGGAGPAVGRVIGAEGSLGPALAAHLSTANGNAPVVYLVADESAAESRVDDVGFFLAARPAEEDPLAPAAVELWPAVESSPYAEIQPDRRTLLQRMAVLYRLAGRAVAAGAGRLGRWPVPQGDPPGGLRSALLPGGRRGTRWNARR